MAINNNKFLPLILDGVDMMVAENQRKKAVAEQQKVLSEQNNQKKQQQSLANKSSFLNAMLSDKNLTPESKQQASSLLTQLITNPETDLSGFKPAYQQPEAKDPIIEMPADVRKYYPTAPEKAPQSVVKMFMDNARMIRNNELDAQTTKRGQDSRNKGDDTEKRLRTQMAEINREMSKFQRDGVVTDSDKFKRLENMRLALVSENKPLDSKAFSNYMNAVRNEPLSKKDANAQTPATKQQQPENVGNVDVREKARLILEQNGYASDDAAIELFLKNNRDFK